ncbi:MAG: STAS domain-containing protein [Treponema sp.]|nr:STAS domain-containing protein [Treponema sp.]MBQ7618954.1 STAS domain-containing protein [Treponema sp.]
MEIKQTKDGNKLTIALEGRLDTMTAPDLEGALEKALDGVNELVFDFGQVQYISSAGLRILLSTQKKIGAAGGSMKLVGVNDSVKEVFEVTGFINILSIE